MKFMKGVAVSGKKMRTDLPTQIYRKGNVSMKFVPGQFVADDMIKKFNIRSVRLEEN